jgi:hypothetical protein
MHYIHSITLLSTVQKRIRTVTWLRSFPAFLFRPEKYMISEHEEKGVGDDIRNHPRKGTGAISFRYSARP